MQIVAENVKTSLAQLGILVEISPIGVSDLNKMLQTGEKDYDMVIA